MPGKTPSAWNTPAFLAPRSLRPWLTGRDSLTARLIRHHGRIRVTVLQQKTGQPLFDEIAAASLPGRHQSLIREVLLLSDAGPMVFAHSVTGAGALRGELGLIRRQGNKPLGATLFANPRVQRSRLQLTRLRPSHPLWQKAQRHLTTLPAILWARRSSFRLAGTCLLVTEVFLPGHLESLS